jgi:hypothetical protein
MLQSHKIAACCAWNRFPAGFSAFGPFSQAGCELNVSQAGCELNVDRNKAQMI